MTELGQPKCELCGEPMPKGEEMFKFHGYSGDCPKPPLPANALDGERNVIAIIKERGEFLRLEDGFYYYFPSSHSGGIPAHLLREIADELDIMNKPWQESIEKELGGIHNE